MPLPGTNLSPIRAIFIALLVVGCYNLIKKGMVIAQFGKLAYLPPAVPVNSAILKCLFVVPEEESQMLSLSCDVVLFHLNDYNSNSLYMYLLSSSNMGSGLSNFSAL